MTNSDKDSIMDDKVVTVQNPIDMTNVSSGYRGKIVIAQDKVSEITFENLDNACPTHSFGFDKKSQKLSVDHGKCITCDKCSVLSPTLIKIKSNFASASKHRTGLVESFDVGTITKSYDEIGKELKEKIHNLYGRSLAIREVDAGSCNGCEVEITALNNPIYDIARFGIHFVASPRHADLLLVTGPASRNMEVALKRTYDATPNPKLVVAVGACACSGGIFGDTYATTGGIDKIVPVDVYIPGCPPRPQALIYGLLLAIDKKLDRKV
jgi:Ni,Fe-hydrogenase III small subunit/ferredoxin-like protein FixX